MERDERRCYRKGGNMKWDMNWDVGARGPLVEWNVTSGGATGRVEI